MRTRSLRPLLLIAALITSGCAAAEPASEIDEVLTTRPDTATLTPRAVAIGGFETTTAQRTTWRDGWRAPGRLHLDPGSTHALGASVDGRVTRVLTYPGDRVQEGQVLAALHSPQMLDATAALASARAGMTSAESGLRLASEAAARAERLHNARALSRAELEAATAAQVEAEARHEQARSELERARELYDHLVGSGPVPDGATHGEALIRSPIDGVVTAREAEPGTVALTGTPLITVSRLDTLALSIHLPEEAVAVARRGAPVRFTLPAYPGRTFSATIERVAASVDTRTRTLEVVARVDNSEGLLRPEMYVDAEVLGEGTEEAIIVPVEAVHLLDEVTIVVRAEEGGDGGLFIEAVPVRTGRRTGSIVEILAGIDEGTTIVVTNAATARAELLRRR